MPEMNRRAFVKTLVSVPVVAALPVAMLGNPAGGFYAPVPADIESLLQWLPRQSSVNQLLDVEAVVGAALYRVVGESLARLQMFRGTVLVHPTDTAALVERRRQDVIESLRTEMTSRHDPGWFKATKTVAVDTPSVDDEDGDYGYALVDAWTRVDYVRWLHPNDLKTMEIRIA